MTHYLYIWHCPPTYTKVGISNNPESRLAHAQANNPQLMTLVAKIEFANETLATQAETQLCYVLNQFKVHGEWFGVESNTVIALCRFIEVSLGNAVSVMYPQYRVNIRRSTKSKLTQKAAIQYIRDNHAEYETIRKTVLNSNPIANKREIAEAIAERMTGDTRGYMTVIRAYRKLGLEL